MNILKVWDAEYPWDVRVEKVCRALHSAGHAVHIVARNRDRRPLVEHLPGQGTVHRMRPFPSAGPKLNAVSMFPAFFNPRWLGLIHSTARRNAAEMILCRDLPLAPTAILAARRLGLPVVLDMAENYPAMMRSIWETGRQTPIDWLVRNPALVAAVERWTLPRVDHTLTVVDESRDRLVAMGIPPRKVSVVSNTPPLARVEESQVSGSRPGNANGLHIVYLGLLEAPRGVGTFLEALALCRDAGLNVRASVIGDGREREVFERQARELRLTGDRVSFLGYVPYAEALGIVAEADAGVIPHHADESWNTTIPNKLFDYMAAAIPVIGSDARPTARIIRETGCGEVFASESAEGLAAAVRRLLDPAHRRRCGAAGQQAVITRYHWEVDAEQLLGALETTLERSRVSGPRKPAARKARG